MKKELFVKLQTIVVNFPKMVFKMIMVTMVYCITWISIALVFMFTYWICMIDFEPITLNQAMLERFVLLHQLVIGWVPAYCLKNWKPYQKLISLV